MLATVSGVSSLQRTTTNYYDLKCQERLFITLENGMNQDPVISERHQMHTQPKTIRHRLFRALASQLLTSETTLNIKRQKIQVINRPALCQLKNQVGTGCCC